jgi:ubiquinone biosynthesis protein UbiJ
MSIKDRIVSEGMRLATNPQVAKLLSDERFMKLVMTAMSVPGRVSTFTTEQKENFAKTMGLATADEVRDLRRTVASLEQTVSRLRAKIESGQGSRR